MPIQSIAPIAFVLLWSSGFIVGRLIVGSIAPNIFLSVRFTLSALMFAAMVWIWKSHYPKLATWHKHFTVGALTNGLYLGGSYWAISKGLGAALMALIGGLQPLFTLAIAALFLQERVGLRALAGIMIGLAGLYLAVSPTLAVDGLQISVLAAALLSVVSITVGLLLQKHWLGTSSGTSGVAAVLPSLVLQNISGLLIALLLAWLLDETLFVINGAAILGIAWAVFVLSGLGLYLFIWLMNHAGAVKTTALVLLAPPLAAVQAKLIFDEALLPIQMAGFAIALAGVYLCQRSQHRSEN